jgi:replicative DNA helicase
MEHISTFLGRFFERAFDIRRLELVRQGEGSDKEGYQYRFIGVPTGFIDLDEMTGGLQQSDLITIAAEPNVGKTEFCLSVLSNAAFRYGKRIAVFSFDLTGEAVVQHLLAMNTGIEMQRLASGQIDDDEWHLVSSFLGDLDQVPIHLNDEALSSDELIDQVEALVKSTSLDLIIIDSLEYIRGGKKALAGISCELKRLSRQRQIPIVASLSIEPLRRWGKVPELSDLAPITALDEDADIVLFIYREELYDGQTGKKGIAEIHIAKHRNGPLGVVNLRFFHTIKRFVDLEQYRESA